MKRVVRAPMVDAGKSRVDLETLRAVVASHVHVLADYARRVVYRVHQDEVAGAPKGERHELRPLKRLIPRADHRLGERERAYLRDGLSKSRALATVYEFQQRLLMLFSERQASQERLLQSLQEWCEAAEATGIAALEEFARRLAGYRLVA